MCMRVLPPFYFLQHSFAWWPYRPKEGDWSPGTVVTNDYEPFHISDEKQMLVLWKNSQFPVKHWAISPDLFSCSHVQVFQVWKCVLDLYGHRQGYYSKGNCVDKDMKLTKWACRRKPVVCSIWHMEVVTTKFTKKICFNHFSYLNVRENRVYQLCRKLDIL